MGALTSVLDVIFLAFFIIHIPTTLLVDSQSVFPAEYYPPWAKEALKWHIEMNGDHLVSKNPTWFVSLVWGEVLYQLPFFFVASYAFIKRRNWIRVPSIIYGAHVVTTMIPILTDILFGPDSGPKRHTLAAIYVPYLIVPLLLLVRMAVVEQPFGADDASKRGVKRKAQ
ncbi:hypothetical protein GPECTOR_3g172 [Gonium pectorale]|uniref:EXPERA domain-containing protein n=1 Tax=Gonium pectorale TaxID=33097 RepID=A0A150GYU0_GONPE|nr:hypothetical protein GPECTOR_3g172 [Gonium pectorale]|eukprot:KXZ55009.1 hypothetical protein GPECTOR_3g172 [Gonium pectorale]